MNEEREEIFTVDDPESSSLVVRFIVGNVLSVESKVWKMKYDIVQNTYIVTTKV